MCCVEMRRYREWEVGGEIGDWRFFGFWYVECDENIEEGRGWGFEMGWHSKMRWDIARSWGVEELKGCIVVWVHWGCLPWWKIFVFLCIMICCLDSGYAVKGFIFWQVFAEIFAWNWWCSEDWGWGYIIIELPKARERFPFVGRVSSSNLYWGNGINSMSLRCLQ